MIRYAPHLLTVALIVTGSQILLAPQAQGAGFEVSENTPRSVARGGTGAVNQSDPSALYFNPALLPRARENQVLISSNFLTLNVEFQRDDFSFERGGQTHTRTFAPAQNQTGIFPAPFLTASFDVGPENLTVGAGIFGPPAFGNPCYGPREGGDCAPAPEGATRGMVNEVNVIVAYLGAGAGYRFDLGEDREFSVGLTAALAYMNTDFAVFAEAYPSGSQWEEDPRREAFIFARNLIAIAPTGIIGVAFADGPLRLAASYRPPIKWQATGTAEVDFPEVIQDFEPALSDERVHLETWHAGSLRLGWGLEGGTHPADSLRSRWDLEVNVIWENWSLVDFFRLELEGDIEYRWLADSDGNYDGLAINPVYQVKGYQDTFALRAGFSWGFSSNLTGHMGGFLETAAQPLAYTSPDFVSWERYSASLGTTIHLLSNLDLTLAYAYIHSPSRVVTDGRIHNPIPLSACSGPDFDNEYCRQPGTPPGNPQNEGQWQANFQVFSAGLTLQY